MSGFTIFLLFHFYRHLGNWMLRDTEIDVAEMRLLKALYYIGKGLSWIQVALVFFSSWAIYMFLPSWQYHHENSAHFCDFGTVLFYSSFSGLFLGVMLIGMICTIYIIYTANVKRNHPMDFYEQSDIIFFENS